MAVTLWSKNGKLISNDDKLQLIECEQCPCDDGGTAAITIDLSCPSSLHTLGEGKPFSITATYADPSESSVLPHIEITYDCDPADTNVSIVLESGGIMDFATGWTGTLGTDTVLTFDAGNIMAIGTIMENGGTGRTCNATITAWDPDRVDTNGNPIEPVTRTIALWDDVNCSITAPSSECDGKEFSASLTTSGTGAAGNLVRMDSDDGIFSNPQTRFELYLNGIDINPGGTSKWTKGKWEGTKLSNSGADPMEISFEEYGVELCSSEEITVKKCGISSITVTCPECLHTLADGDTLTIVVVYDDIAGWSGLPDVSVTPNISAIIDEDTQSAPDFNSHWVTNGDTRTWTRSIRPSASYLSDSPRSASVTFAVGSDKYVDGNGDRLDDVTCSTHISDVVTCDGVTLTPMSDNPCTGGTLIIHTALKGDCGGAEGAQLTSINSPLSGLFGTWPPDRFSFEITGDYEMVEEEWENGVYDALIKMTGVKDEFGVIEDIEVTVSEYGEELCYGTFTPVPCEVTATIDCPDSLHTLGPSKWLTITLTYTDAEYYAPLLGIELYQGATPYSASSIGLIMEDEMGGTEVATFEAEEWQLAGNVRTWRHKVQINSMPEEWEDGDAISIRVIMDYEDSSGNDVIGDHCSIALHYKVECDGNALIQSACCVHEEVPVTITLTGTNGDKLTRMNSGGSRFSAAITGGGITEWPSDAEWVEGVWSTNVTPVSYQDNPVTVTLTDTAETEPLCENEMLVNECGCSAVIICPDSLHVYGDAGHLKIVLTYTDPHLSYEHPTISLSMAAAGDPIETLYIDGGDEVSFADTEGNWTESGGTKTWENDIVIRGVAHPDGNTTVTITITHINAEGDTEILDSRGIAISERVSCTVTLPGDQCETDGPFTLDMSAVGDPGGEALTEFPPSAGGRFFITAGGLELGLAEGVSIYDNWANGEITFTGVTGNAGSYTALIYDEDYPLAGCEDTITIHDCTMTAIISGCPVTVHSLGAGAEITITVYYASYDFYRDDATVSFTGNAATWDGGSWVPGGGGTKIMTGTVTGVLNAAGTATLTVTDPDGNPLAECIITVVNGVECSISFNPEIACITTEENPVTVTVTIDVEGEQGIPLTRLSDNGGRFLVEYAGLAGTVTNEQWGAASYTATMPSEESVMVSLSDSIASDTICYALYEAGACSLTGTLSCPTTLHTLGAAQPFGVSVNYTNPDLYSAYPVIDIYYPGESGTPTSTCVTMTGSWSGLTGTARTYSGTIAATCLPDGALSMTSDMRIVLREPRTLDILDVRWINVTAMTSCTVSVYPDTVYMNESFEITVEISPVGYTGLLPFIDERGNFEVVITGTYSGGSGCSMTSGWSDTGVWTCGGLTSEAESIAVDVYRNGTQECYLDIPTEDPAPSVTFGCPKSLHTLGAAKTLTLTYTTNHPDYMPYFEVSSPLLLDAGTETTVNLNTDWTSQGNFTYQWQRDVYVDEVPGSGHTGTITISAYYDPVNGDPVPIGTPCTIDVTDEVACNINAPTEVCIEDEFTVSISITDINGGILSRLDSTAFNGRFSLDIDSAITVPSGCAPGSGWSQGQWSCSGLYIGLSASAFIMIKDSGSITCQTYIDARNSRTPFAIEEHPINLHIYGEAGTLRLVLWGEGSCEHPNMSEWVITHSLLVDGVGYPLNSCLSLANGDPISFSSGWVDGVWEHDIRLNSAPFAQGADSCSMDLEIVATHAISGGETLFESAYIMGMRDLIADIVFSPTSCYPYAGFEVTISITSSIGKLPRLPSNGGVTISRGPEDEDSTATLHRSSGTISFSFTDGVCTLDKLYVDEVCTYYIKAEQDLSGEDKEVGYGSIKIALESPDLDDLIEAINERRGFQGTGLLSTNTTNLNTVRTWVNYVNRDWAVSHNSNGDLQYDANFSTLPPTAPAAGAPQSEWDAYYDAVDGWISDAYVFVCRKVERSGGGTVEKRARCGLGGHLDPGRPGGGCCGKDSTTSDDTSYYCATTSFAGAFRIAKSEALAMSDGECYGPYSGTYIMQGYSSGDKRYYYYTATPIVNCWLTRRYARLKSSTSSEAVARYRRTVYGWVARPSLYNGSGASNVPFNPLGEGKMPPAGGKILYWTYSGSGTLFYSPWSLKTPPPILEPPSPPLCYDPYYRGSLWKSGGYALTMSTVLQKVSFKH